jgi:hypothetical protein
MTMQPHRYADIVPMAPSDIVASLARNIRSQGQRHPIITLDDAILDGRARYLACRRAGIVPKMEAYRGDDALLYVLKHNRDRLNISQMAMVIARAVVVFQRDQQELTSKLDVSMGSARRAMRILMNGTEEQVAAVLAGKESVSAIIDENQAKPRKFVPPPPTPERRRTTLSDAAELWSHLREAFQHLGSLPRASDAAASVGKLTPAVRAVVDQKLPGVIKWMEEFAHEWKSGNEHRALAKSQDSTTDRPAGGRDSDAGDAAGAGGDDDPRNGARAAQAQRL